MTFAQALESCPRLKPHAREGLRALGNNRSRVTTTHTRLIRGSIDVEAAQRAISGQYTWDYGIGFAAESGELAIWVEVHPANSLHVGIILDKLQSLLEFLTEHAPGMRRLPPRYVWLATKGVGIAPDSRERRRLNARGVILRSKQLDLESVV